MDKGQKNLRDFTWENHLRHHIGVLLQRLLTKEKDTVRMDTLCSPSLGVRICSGFKQKPSREVLLRKNLERP